MFFLLAVHIYLIQKQGMSLPLAVEGKKEKVKEIPFWPNFVYREMIVWLFLLGVLFSLAIFFPPSLDKAADLMAPAPQGIKPEWYFLFLFQSLKVFPSKIFFLSGETLAVLVMLVEGILFFFLPLFDNKPAEMKGKIITIMAWVSLAYGVAMTVWSLL
jgi:quinol-cytochrome oxidoreductase complex cytochrome b subunit